MSLPLVLVDDPDGVCEAKGWVEGTVSEAEARNLLAELATDEDGEPRRPDGTASKVWLRRVREGEDFGEEEWLPCEPLDDDAVEFWEIVTS